MGQGMPGCASHIKDSMILFPLGFLKFIYFFSETQAMLRVFQLFLDADS